APLPDNLMQAHHDTLQNRLPGETVSGHGSTFPPPSQDHCPAGGCGQSENSWESFKFRKALATIGRGEDPLSRFVDRVEQVHDNIVGFVMDRHPILSAIMITSKEVQGEFVAEQVDLLDRATGRVISESWNNLDQNLRDELSGLLKIVAVTPVGTSVKKLCSTADFFKGTRYTDKVKLQMTQGDFHAFPDSVEAFQDTGVITKLTGGDGVLREKLEIPGSYKGQDGHFEFIKEPDGLINHRLFKPKKE
ncbi:MAG: hypothetical protein ACR2PX_05390, partial [Endozoicomonas sp.]